MGQLLTNVISTNDRGLVGFTETSEEVPLSAPKIGLCHVNDKEYLIQTLEKGTYIQLPEDHENWEAIPYNFYTRRK